MKTQLLVIALFGVMAACVLADDKPTCGLLERVKVRRQWAHAYGDSEHRMDFVIAVFNNFFKAYPKSRELFPKVRGDNVYSPEFQAHGHRVLAALGMVIQTGDDVETMKVMVEALKKSHVERGIKYEYFEAFVNELLVTLPEFVGRHFDYDAWRPCMDLLLAGLK